MSGPADTAKVQPVTLNINGREVQAESGQTILEAARAAGIEIPTLCHDPRLEPYGACRMCLVEVEGARGPMAACGTAVRDGMKIQTHSEKILKLRKFVLELLLTNHPLDCPVCEAAGDCRLQDYAYEYLVDMVPWGWRPPVLGKPGAHPNVAHFGARCILCGRCVRICREVMSIGCWGYLNRGYESEVDTPYRLPLQEVDCVSCGQCISTCPVGSIVGQRMPQGARFWQTDKTSTTCSYCADGCRFTVHSYRDRVVRVASELEKGLNGGNLCVRGRFAWGYASAADRVTAPLVRNASGKLEETSWQAALALVKEKVEEAGRAKGGQAVAAICGTHATNEAAYLLQKLMRSVVGSNNVDAIDHADIAAAEQALETAFGLAAASNSRRDLDNADVILVVGANLTECDPVLCLDVIKALRAGRTIIVIDPRRTELASKARYHLPIKPGSDLAALRAIMKQILDLGLQDTDFVRSRTEGFEEFERSLNGVDLAAEAEACGVDADLLRDAALAFGQAGSAAVLFGAGVERGPKSTETVAALADLVMLTGNIGRPGTGLLPLRLGANSQGLADMGIRPDRLPGGSALADTDARARAEAAWGGSVAPGTNGLSLPDMVSAMGNGDLSVLYVMGADPALAIADETAVREALDKVDFVVVQDSFVTDTAQYADVVLPAAVATEDEGTFTNHERFVQRVRAANPPLGQSLPDWRILQTIANELGADWAYDGPVDVMREIADLVPHYRGITYEKLQAEGIQWPCTGVDCGGTSILFADGFPRGKGAFAPVAGGIAETGAVPEYPFVLVTGSVREHHATGERTRRSPGSTQLVPEARLQLSAADAAKVGVNDGGRVRVSAANGGQVEVDVRISGMTPEGVVFLPGFSPAAPVTRLLTPENPESVPVAIEKIT